MSKSKPTKETAMTVTKRVLIPLQSTGRVGKSTLIQAVAYWADFAGIDWAGLDGDAEHKTFSKKHQVTLAEFTADADMFKRTTQNIVNLRVPLVLMDVPAQATASLLNMITEQRTLEVLEQNNIRVTVPIFPADDETAIASMATTFKTLENRVDYLLVKNSAKFKTTRFDASPLRGKFLAGGASTLEIPALTASTLEDIDAASKKAGKHLTWQDSVPSLPISSRFELESWLNRLLVQCEEAASLLIPDVSLIKNKVERASVTTGPAKVDEFDPLSA